MKANCLILVECVGVIILALAWSFLSIRGLHVISSVISLGRRGSGGGVGGLAPLAQKVTFFPWSRCSKFIK